jgi:hypothetical protein
MSSFLRANGIVMRKEKHEQTTTTRAVLLDKKKLDWHQRRFSKVGGREEEPKDWIGGT